MCVEWGTLFKEKKEILPLIRSKIRLHISYASTACRILLKTSPAVPKERSDA